MDLTPRYHEDIAQRTPEWHALRCGTLTSTSFGKVITPKTLKPSKQVGDLMNTLLAEWALGEPVRKFEGTTYTERGTLLEDEALDDYRFRYAPARTIGFVSTCDGLAGASPDGLIGDDETLELKCPSPAVHVHYLRDPKALLAQYRMQLEATLWVTQRARAVLYAYHPSLPPVRIVHPASPDLQAALTAAVPKFALDMLAQRELLLARGVVPRRATQLNPEPPAEREPGEEG